MQVTVKNGKAHVLEMANRAAVQKLNAESVSAITARLDNHESGLNTNAHGISNIAGLTTALNDVTGWINDLETSVADLGTGKQDAFTGYTGSVTVITGVNFGAQTVTTKTLTINNGVVTNVS